MKFFTAFAAGLALVSSALTAPASFSSGISGRSHIEARADGCPSVETIQVWLRGNTKIGDRSVFYTGSASNEQAKNYANKVGGQYWGSLFPQDKFFDWIDECGHGPEQDKLVPRMAEAMAKESHGEAFVLLPKNEPVNAGKIWMTTEYPNLRGRVQVTAVNSKNPDETQPNWSPDSDWSRPPAPEPADPEPPAPRPPQPPHRRS